MKSGGHLSSVYSCNLHSLQSGDQQRRQHIHEVSQTCTASLTPFTKMLVRKYVNICNTAVVKSAEIFISTEMGLRCYLFLQHRKMKN